MKPGMVMKGKPDGIAFHHKSRSRWTPTPQKMWFKLVGKTIELLVESNTEAKSQKICLFAPLKRIGLL